MWDGVGLRFLKRGEAKPQPWEGRGLDYLAIILPLSFSK